MYTGCLPLKAGFKRSASDIGKIAQEHRFYSSGLGGFQIGDLPGKIGRITAAEHSKAMRTR